MRQVGTVIRKEHNIVYFPHIYRAEYNTQTHGNNVCHEDGVLVGIHGLSTDHT